MITELKVNLDKIKDANKLELQVKKVCEYLIERSGKNLDYNVVFNFRGDLIDQNLIMMEIEYMTKFEIIVEEREPPKELLN